MRDTLLRRSMTQSLSSLPSRLLCGQCRHHSVPPSCHLLALAEETVPADVYAVAFVVDSARDASDHAVRFEHFGVMPVLRRSSTAAVSPAGPAPAMTAFMLRSFGSLGLSCIIRVCEMSIFCVLKSSRKTLWQLTEALPTDNAVTRNRLQGTL